MICLGTKTGVEGVFARGVQGELVGSSGRGMTRARAGNGRREGIKEMVSSDVLRLWSKIKKRKRKKRPGERYKNWLVRGEDTRQN
jgi:hypothetical protein